MDYKYSCVVDADNLYKTFVLVYLEPGENGELRETIPGYELAEGEHLLEVSPPSNLVKPRWNGGTWEEAATVEEIEAWKQEQPPLDLPGDGPTQEQRLSALEQQTTDTQLALVEAYEQTDGQNTDLMLATAELYESLLALQARVAALEGGAENG